MTPWSTIRADARALPLADESVQCVCTSPPYWMQRDYGLDGQIGLESLEDFVAAMVQVFREVRRVLRPDGTCWINLGDSYIGARGGAQGLGGSVADRVAASRGVRVRNGDRRAEGLKDKDLVGVPWRIALALQADGWWLRSEVIWHKPCPLPETVEDRPHRTHEHVFLLTRSASYYYDAEAIKEPVTGGAHPRGKGTHPRSDDPGFGVRANGSFSSSVRGLVDRRHKRTVWSIVPANRNNGSVDGHFAVMPVELAEVCVLAGSRPGDVVLDPFCGTATTGIAAIRHGRRFVGVDLGYQDVAQRRLVEEWARLGRADEKVAADRPVQLGLRLDVGGAS